MYMSPNLKVLKIVCCLLKLQSVNIGGWDKMAAIPLMTFSNAFFFMKTFEFCTKFHQIMFL